jgi:hypothetical protein
MLLILVYNKKEGLAIGLKKMMRISTDGMIEQWVEWRKRMDKVISMALVLSIRLKTC